jgi:6-phosphofructokinase 1
MIKRHINGRPYGVVIIAEGIGGRLDPEEFEKATYDGVERDEHGHVRLADVDLGRVLRHEVRERFLKRGQKPTIVMKNLGYELRCAAPIPFDLEYTRDLGFWAVRYLMENSPDQSHGAMITLDQDKLTPMEFDDFIDSKTGRPRVRYVDVRGESYQVARKYMIFLDETDLNNTKSLKSMADFSQITPEEFRNRFEYLAKRNAS